MSHRKTGRKMSFNHSGRISRTMRRAKNKKEAHIMRKRIAALATIEEGNESKSNN